jgi:hypothetical protein
MTRLLKALCAALLLPAFFCNPPALAATASAGIRFAEAQFRIANPCPVTGQPQGPCAGYVIDRIIPLVCGGAEHPDNMRWITIAEAKAKAKWDRIGCRPGRKLVLPSEWKSVTEAFPLENAPEPVEAAPLTESTPAPADETPAEENTAQ